MPTPLRAEPNMRFLSCFARAFSPSGVLLVAVGRDQRTRGCSHQHLGVLLRSVERFHPCSLFRTSNFSCPFYCVWDSFFGPQFIVFRPATVRQVKPQFVVRASTKISTHIRKVDGLARSAFTTICDLSGCRNGLLPCEHVVFQLRAEAIRQACESAHPHPHGEILAFQKTTC